MGSLTCILSRVKQITSPGWMHETSARTWCTGKTQRDRVEREVGGGIRMGNTCKSMADSFQCMTKPTTIKKKKKKGKKIINGQLEIGCGGRIYSMKMGKTCKLRFCLFVCMIQSLNIYQHTTITHNLQRQKLWLKEVKYLCHPAVRQ